MLDALEEFMRTTAEGVWFRIIRGEDGFTFMASPHGSRYAFSFTQGWQSAMKQKVEG
jgi:hypothetical protein